MGAKGDCIDCMACVNVCPMGIDIRDGQQMACITCGLCIDACDEIMDKIGKPRGLIDYMALTDETRERAGPPRSRLETCPAPAHDPLYTCCGGVGVAWWWRCSCGRISTSTCRPVRNPTFVTLSDGTIRNTYDIRLRNKLGSDTITH